MAAKGKGRRRIEMKRVEENTKRLVTFSKRKAGLLRKASHLSLLCDSEIAVIVFSEKGKAFSSGYPHGAHSVIGRYLSGHSDRSPSAAESCKARKEVEEAKKGLEKEKKVAADSDVTCEGSLWWERPIEDMGLEELLELKEKMEELRSRVVEKEAEMAAKAVTFPEATREELDLLEAMLSVDDDVSVGENAQTCGWDGDWDFWKFSDDGANGFDFSHLF